MADDSRPKYVRCYSVLLRLYPRPYRERFGEPMQQAFNDVLRERAERRKGLSGSALRMFVDTSAGIVRENMGSIAAPNRSIVWLAIVTALILAIPLIAMQFTDEVVWGPVDFVLAGVVIFGAGLAFILISRRMPGNFYKGGLAVAIGTSFMILWSNGAVGIVGDEDNPANALYYAVLLTGFVGSLAARFQPHRMAVAATATAIVNVAVAIVALFIWRVPGTSVEINEVMLNGVFVALFAVSGMLFSRAQTPPDSRR